MTDVLAIANANAGTATERAQDAAMDMLHENRDVVLATTSSPDDLAAALAEHHDAGCVVVLGGDGSLHAVVAALHDAGRPPELVGRQRHQVRSDPRHVDREATDGLARVGVEQHLRLPTQPRRLADRLHRPDLMVRVLQRGEQRAGATDLGREPVEVDLARGVDGDADHLEPVGLERVPHAEHGWVLDVADHDPRAELTDRPHPTPDRERHRFGAARSEHDLVGLGAEPGGEGRASLLQRPARRAPVVVDPQGVAEGL